MTRLAQAYTGYNYYGSTSPGTEPQRKSDWDKFMEFNNVAMGAVSNILGSWLQGRAQAQSAQTMADALKSMPPADRQKIMQAYMVQQMLQQQGYQTGANPMQMQQLGQAWNMIPRQQTQQAASGALSFLGGNASGNAQIQALLGQQGARFGVSGAAQWPSWLLPGIAVAGVAVAAIFLPRLWER